MRREKLDKLAKRFVKETLRVAPGENAWIEHRGLDAAPLAMACAEAVSEAGGNPILIDSGSAATKIEIERLDAGQIFEWGRRKLELMRTMDVYVRVEEDFDFAALDLSEEKRAEWQRAMGPVNSLRMDRTRWLVLAAPSKAFAKAHGLTRERFDRFYLDICLADPTKMRKAVEPLRKLLAEAEDVVISAPRQGTLLRFSVAGIAARACTGGRNVPDGECYTAPVLGSAEGTIVFGPSWQRGHRFERIALTLSEGVVVDAEADSPERTKALLRILDSDPGAGRFGEFAIGFNPLAKTPTGNILFDEKIDGSLHLALGRCYKEVPNGNDSSIHWDLVQIQRPEFGGGTIAIDGRVIREDGRFVVPELLELNPERLLE
jgi:aminopeptidase